LKDAFYQLLFSQKQIGLLQDIAGRQKANMQLVQMNFKGGTDNKGSFLQAQASFKEAEYEVSQSERALRVAQRQLAQILGRSPLDSLEVGGDFNVPPPPSSLPDFLHLALNTPTHLQALAGYHSSQSQWLSARGAFFPNLSANASVSRGNWDTSFSNPSWSAGLFLNFPLFTGGRDLFNFKSAEESQTRAEEELRSTDLKTESRLESAFASFQNASENIKVQVAFLDAAQTREEIAKAEYLNGLLSFQNWDQIESNLTLQQKAELSSFLGVKTAEAEWELAQGKGVFE
jgi:outer membrane protein TolC